jgi:hypothetical protein
MAHLDEIKDLLHKYVDFLSVNTCDELLEYIHNNPNIFIDRSKYYPNYSVRGDLGKYYAAEVSPKSLTDLWEKYFVNVEIDGFPVKEVQINKYEQGSFIPPHVDKGMSLHTIIVPLQTNSENKLVFGDPDVYYNNTCLDDAVKNGLVKIFRDEKGVGYHFEGTTPIHWVPPVNKLRYSLVMLF